MPGSIGLMILFFVLVLLAALVQSTTGFGMVIVLMIFFPYFLPFHQATALSQALHLALNILLVWQYRRHVAVRHIVLPLILYFPLFFVFLSLAEGVDASALRPGLGLVLLLIAAGSLKPKSPARKGLSDLLPKPAFAFLCVFLNALIDAFFGVGAPFIAMYFLTVVARKEAYIGTIQAYCMVTMVFAVAMRFLKGQYVLEMAPLFGLGLVALSLGILLGGRIVKGLDMADLKKIVYGFIGVAGAITLITSVF